mmetsp:Transcript_19265/g.53347  ORF Transcript_19265/g.53347 Transcript_19265/m.53347 type:complete len:265 (+) Transcript_19265:2697-3491(+)
MPGLTGNDAPVATSATPAADGVSKNAVDVEVPLAAVVNRSEPLEALEDEVEWTPPKRKFGATKGEPAPKVKTGDALLLQLLSLPPTLPKAKTFAGEAADSTPRDAAADSFAKQLEPDTSQDEVDVPRLLPLPLAKTVDKASLQAGPGSTHVTTEGRHASSGPNARHPGPDVLFTSVRVSDSEDSGPRSTSDTSAGSMRFAMWRAIPEAPAASGPRSPQKVPSSVNSSSISTLNIPSATVSDLETGESQGLASTCTPIRNRRRSP